MAGMRWKHVCLLAAGAVMTAEASAGPVAIGTSQITVTYQDADGQVVATDLADYAGGSGPLDATQLGDAANIAAFNSNGSTVGTFGRRAAPILLNNPMLPPVFGPNEALVSHAFFKLNNADPFFPGLIEGGDVTVNVQGIQFDQPVSVVEETVMLHAKWLGSQQADQLDTPYVHIDDHFTIAETFRDFDTFYGRIFFDAPTPNYVLNSADLDWSISNSASDTIDLTLTFPYALLRNLEEAGQPVPDGLPSPQGFLEPFHFHIEYVVVPEPMTLLLLLPGVLLTRRRR